MPCDSCVPDESYVALVPLFLANRNWACLGDPLVAASSAAVGAWCVFFQKQHVQLIFFAIGRDLIAYQRSSADDRDCVAADFHRNAVSGGRLEGDSADTGQNIDPARLAPNIQTVSGVASWAGAGATSSNPKSTSAA